MEATTTTTTDVSPYIENKIDRLGKRQRKVLRELAWLSSVKGDDDSFFGRKETVRIVRRLIELGLVDSDEWTRKDLSTAPTFTAPRDVQEYWTGSYTL